MADPAVVVLSSEDFGSIDDMLIARQVISALVLYRVRAGELAAVLVQLREGDDDARRVALAIQAAIRARPLHAAGTTTMSLGVVVRTTETSYDELLRHADGALYAAKARGRDRITSATRSASTRVISSKPSSSRLPSRSRTSRSRSAWSTIAKRDGRDRVR
jgi:hypothetical protein